MSYSVRISVKVEGINRYVEVQELGNITWNVRKLIFHSSGWDIKNEASNGAVLPWLEKIRHGIEELETHPERYKEYESPNGWGTVRGTLEFYKRCVQNAEEWANWEDQELIDAAVVYVD